MRKHTGGLGLRTNARIRPLADELMASGRFGNWHVWTVGSRVVRVTLQLFQMETGKPLGSLELFARHRDFRSGHAFERLLRRAVRS